MATMICEALAAFTTGFLSTMLAAVFKGEEINADVWGEAVANGVISAVGAAAWGRWIAPWAKVGGLADVFRKTADAVRAAGRQIERWAAALVGDGIDGVGTVIYAKLLEAARRLGWSTAAGDLRVMPLGDSITFGQGVPRGTATGPTCGTA
ncbi:hypothetical protein [Streptomyces sp. S.PNR 29]|uniref:hypothetical protein n=1 Tax=Streptomyces sp. S.PNR 29 TaxID=2973805 RepID=UPI0025B23CB8|nr:hypothetical protein [Streptomyces sp. S.PNR 29]MDN0200770.1 hypothetical protein [Streptomyces sp. S.PNR 29]